MSTPEASPPVTTAYLASADLELEDWGPLEEATGAEMQTAGISFWENGEGADSGVWECTPGPSHWTLETNEFINVVAGRMTVTPDGGEPLELGPGSSAVFPVGWSGTWEIHETLRKLYVIY